MAEAGDCAARKLERILRRYLLGMGFGSEGHEKGILDFVYAAGAYRDSAIAVEGGTSASVCLSHEVKAF